MCLGLLQKLTVFGKKIYRSEGPANISSGYAPKYVGNIIVVLINSGYPGCEETSHPFEDVVCKIAFSIRKFMGDLKVGITNDFVDDFVIIFSGDFSQYFLSL